MFNVSVRKIVVSSIVIAAPVAFSLGASSEAWGGHTTQWEKGTQPHAVKTVQWEKHRTTTATKTVQWEKHAPVASKTTMWE